MTENEMSDEFEMNVARDSLLQAARKHITSDFGPIQYEHESHGPNTVPFVKAADPRVFYVPDDGEAKAPDVTIVLKHGARIVNGDTTYTLRYGYSDGHFSYKFSVSRK